MRIIRLPYIFIAVATVTVIGTFVSAAVVKSKWENNEEIQIFREYLRIPSFANPKVNYTPCIEFLKRQAEKLDLPVSISYPVDIDNPVLVMTWEGLQPELPSIVLNSHMDVVPVFEEFWTHPPFAAEIDENGDIHARGAQDMKSIAVQYLAAIRALKRDGIQQLKRTVHVMFVPDEESSSFYGMDAFVKTKEFKSMNVDFLLDEGNPVQSGPLPIYYGERTCWEIEFIFAGNSGHGSKLIKGTPGQKLNYVLGKFMEFRDEETRKLEELKYPYGNLTTINLTIVKGGVASNVIPAKMSAVFDIRISINADLDEFENMMKQWCIEAGGNVTMDFIEKGIKEKVTPLDNLYYVALKNATDELGVPAEPSVRIGASDSRYIRRLGIAALGFSPMPNTIPRLHDHNEYLNAETFLKGIEMYKKIIVNLGNA